MFSQRPPAAGARRGGESDRGSVRAAFTLIEVLVVMAIVAIVVAIVVPALGVARDVARKTATQTLMKDLSSAIGAYRQDHDGRTPGFFSPNEMGMQQNTEYGMSAMQNVLLSLSGGVVFGDGQTVPQSNWIRFGPGPDLFGERRLASAGGGNFYAQPSGPGGPISPGGPTRPGDRYWVDPDLIGTESARGGGVYFSPQGRYFVQLDHNVSHMGRTQHAAIPSLIDAYGQPILAWVEDTAGPRRIEDREDFVRMHSGSNARDRARFYWASNAAFLRSRGLGERGQDQVSKSLIGEGADHLEWTLTGLLGNPNYPAGITGGGDYSDETLPASGRGSVLLHSAGRDGVYLSRDDQGARATRATDNGMRYAWNFLTPGTTTRLLDEDGRPTSVDVLRDFNDIIETSGN